MKFEIPIYDVTLCVILADDLTRARRDLDGWIGKCSINVDGVQALCSSRDNRFALLFRKKNLHQGIIAHEVFHLTIGILRFNAIKVNADDDEAAALLHGYLFKLVYKSLRKALK